MSVESRRSVLVRAAAIAAAVYLSGRECAAGNVDASAYAQNGSWFYKAANASSSSVWFGTLSWASTASINWTVPTFTADAVALGTAPVPFSEPKFTVPATGLPTAITFAGYNISGTGPLKSTVTSVGAGSSNVGILFYGANWNVTVKGSGTYSAYAVAKDPWNISQSDITHLNSPTGTYSLYLPFTMSQAHDDVSAATKTSGYEFDLSYTKASGTTTLLDVLVNKTTVTVTPSSAFGSNLLFYVEPNATTSPSGSATTPGTLLTTSQLTSLITSDVNSNGDLVSPINLGVVLSGIPVPTVLLSDGTSVAQIENDAAAFQSATVPEPGSFVLAAVGACITAAVAAYRRRVWGEKKGRH
jgi:hypothetical protein